MTSERRHAVEVEIGSLWTAVAFVLVRVGTVAVLVHALCRFVRIIVANLFVLLLLFNASETKRTHVSCAPPGHIRSLGKKTGRLDLINCSDLGCTYLASEKKQLLVKHWINWAATIVVVSVIDDKVSITCFEGTHRACGGD